MTNFTRFDIALIGVKFFALYLILQIIGSIPSWVMTFSMIFGQSVLVNIPYSKILKSFIIILPILMLAIPILLWIFANPISQFIINTPKNIVSNKDISGVNLKEIQTMLFCGIGLFVAVMTIPELLGWTYSFIRAYMKPTNLFQPQWPNFPNNVDLIVLVLKTTFSLALIFRAENISILIYKLRYAGFQKQI